MRKTTATLAAAALFGAGAAGQTLTDEQRVHLDNRRVVLERAARCAKEAVGSGVHVKQRPEASNRAGFWGCFYEDGWPESAGGHIDRRFMHYLAVVEDILDAGDAEAGAVRAAALDAESPEADRIACRAYVAVNRYAVEAHGGLAAGDQASYAGC